jgi:hypothetical protein
MNNQVELKLLSGVISQEEADAILKIVHPTEDTKDATNTGLSEAALAADRRAARWDKLMSSLPRVPTAPSRSSLLSTMHSQPDEMTTLRGTTATTLSPGQAAGLTMSPRAQRSHRKRFLSPSKAYMPEVVSHGSAPVVGFDTSAEVAATAAAYGAANFFASDDVFAEPAAAAAAARGGGGGGGGGGVRDSDVDECKEEYDDDAYVMHQAPGRLHRSLASRPPATCHLPHAHTHTHTHTHTSRCYAYGIEDDDVDSDLRPLSDPCLYLRERAMSAEPVKVDTAQVNSIALMFALSRTHARTRTRTRTRTNLHFHSLTGARPHSLQLRYDTARAVTRNA